MTKRMSEPEESKPVSGRTETENLPPSRSVWKLAKAYAVLFVHGAACVALALSMVLGLDGYEAGDDSNPRHVEGKLLLRVDDITTLISIALVVIKLVVASWSTTVLWASGRYMLYRAEKPESPTRVSAMLRWNLPPWLLGMEVPGDLAGWAISFAIIASLIQAFTSPLLTGSVHRNTSFRVSNTAVTVSAVDPTAGLEGWYWYNTEGPIVARYHLRFAAGFANLAWADPSTIGTDGKSLSGNGCRHVVNNDGLPPNSVLVDAILPCIHIHGIRWYRSADEMADEDWADVVDSEHLPLVGDNPFGYSPGGTSLVYDAKDMRLRSPSADNATIPPSQMFSGTKTVALLIGRYNVTQPPCKNLINTKFGNLDGSPYYLQNRSNPWHENCYLIGKINFTAGVTKSSRARYLTPRVVEDQTRIEEVKFEPNPWIRDALWLLPDLMAMLSLMNTSQLGTFDRIDSYVSGLTRQAYLSAWDMLSHGFDERGPNYSAFPAQTRLVADVSDRRVFSWLALCALVSVTGIFVLTKVLRREDLALPEDRKREEEHRIQHEAAGSVVEACTSY
ncbi:hypothetical protein DL765_007046 [Monosporascus sp. GIB2]|nr:hypothetical protein DL765_007046 [Monosporascus sp. GIB2]